MRGDNIIIAKIHTATHDALLAACDSDLVGKCYKEEGLQLDIREDFYGSVQVDESTFRNMLSGCTVANLCGRKVVDIAVEMGFVDEANVIIIGGIPHAQFAKM